MACDKMAFPYDLEFVSILIAGILYDYPCPYPLFIIASLYSVFLAKSYYYFLLILPFVFATVFLNVLFCRQQCFKTCSLVFYIMLSRI